MTGPTGGERRRESRGAAAISFSADGDRLTVYDPIERHQCSLVADGPVAPEPADPDAFRFPVSEAVAVRVTELDLQTVGVTLRDADGAVVTRVEHFGYEELPAGTYSVELDTAVKLYLRAPGPLSVGSELERTTLSFDRPTKVLVGARSRHERPAATITTTSDPEDLLTAVSYLGSALKTTTPERSFPTLRGHPPTFELGDALDVPAGLERPDTGVTLELPRETAAAFVAAPLAYYLGADVVPGEEPRLVTDTGFVHPLDGPDGYEGAIARTLKQAFFLDCVVRTEGLFPMALAERRAVEDALPFDPAEVYDRPLAEQVEAYLSVDFDAVEAHVPEWQLTTHVEPAARNVELLPYLVNDLAIVRTPRVADAATAEAQAAAVDDFLRDGDFTRSAAADGGATTPETLVPEPTDSLDQAWVGDGAPVGGSKPTVESYRNRLARRPADGDIDITVVCNDPEMDEERAVVDAVYGSRSELPFDVAVSHELGVDELRDVLESEVEFLHYIGHIDADGFTCADGSLDARTLDSVGVDAFFLNACQSYDQGLALIEGGAIGGVVTLRDVINSGAVRVGGTLARLLNRGFPLRAGLDIASGRSIIGGQYVIVGDSGHAVAQSESGSSILLKVESIADGYELTVHSYASSQSGMGSVFMPLMENQSEYYLNTGDNASFTLSHTELVEALELEDVPVQYDGEFYWSGELALSEF